MAQLVGFVVVAPGRGIVLLGHLGDPFDLRRDLAGGVVAYAAGVFNGAPDGGSVDLDLADGKDVAGRLFLSPFKRGTSPLEGLGFGMAGTTGKQSGALPAYRSGGQVSLLTILAGITADGTDVFKMWEVINEAAERALREAQAVEKEEKAKEDAKSTLVAKFKDGFRFESGDKRHAIGISGRVHGDYRYFADDTSANTFDVRRAYLGVQGKLYDIYTFDVTPTGEGAVNRPFPPKFALAPSAGLWSPQG